MAAPHQTKEYSIIHHDDYEIKYIFENLFSLILLIIGILPYDAKIIDIYFRLTLPPRLQTSIFVRLPSPD